MSEEIKVTEENKKTIVAFVAGLLIGGLLVFVFSTPATDDSAMKTDSNMDSSDTMQTDDSMKSSDSMMQDDQMKSDDSMTAPAMMTGEGSIEVSDQAASKSVMLGSVTFPADQGWIGVRDFENGQLTGLLGVARWNKEEGLVPTSVSLLRSTEAGKTYAVVFYSDNGDKTFNLATDVQVDGALSTFVAQ